jgi:hypothetical protein
LFLLLSRIFFPDDSFHHNLVRTQQLSCVIDWFSWAWFFGSAMQWVQCVSVAPRTRLRTRHFSQRNTNLSRLATSQFLTMLSWPMRRITGHRYESQTKLCFPFLRIPLQALSLSLSLCIPSFSHHEWLRSFVFFKLSLSSHL